MNNKLLTAAIIITLAIVGFGIVSLTKSDNQSASSQSTDTSMSTSDMSTMQDMEPNDESDMDMGSMQPVSSNQVTYKGFAVVQKTLKVKKGTTVTWTNEDAAQHDVTPTTETAEFKTSALFGKGETYQVTFNTPGTYSYICSPHPYMKGAIEVTE